MNLVKTSLVSAIVFVVMIIILELICMYKYTYKTAKIESIGGCDYAGRCGVTATDEQGNFVQGTALRPVKGVEMTVRLDI